jgi:hypothetical protein
MTTLRAVATDQARYVGVVVKTTTPAQAAAKPRSIWSD